MRALLVGLFAIVLVAQAAAATMDGEAATSRQSAKASERVAAPKTLDERLARKRAAAQRYRGRISRLESQRRAVSSREQRSQAQRSLVAARERLARVESTIARLETALERRDTHRLAALPPREAICEVFRAYCQEAVAVAWCESRLHTSARNGQYLGLFQMGWSARRIFGHGPTAHDQAVAAHKYFVQSGRDWSPWSCRWAAA